MVWIVILITLAIIGVSWVAGRALNKRSGRGNMSRRDAITAAKVSGAFPIRKENQP